MESPVQHKLHGWFHSIFSLVQSIFSPADAFLKLSSVIRKM